MGGNDRTTLVNVKHPKINLPTYHLEFFLKFSTMTGDIGVFFPPGSPFFVFGVSLLFGVMNQDD